MKKILQISVIMLALAIPFVSGAQSTSGTCTGNIRTDITAATDCINKATAQGQALGYTMSCKVEQLGLGGFTDPTSGKDYILNPVCTVNGSTGHGAYLLAGFTAASGSNAIIQSVNPGWDILKTELAYEGAFAQCGGKAPYYVNNVYACTVPEGALPVKPPVTGSTKTTDSTSGVAVANEVHQTIFASIQNMVKNILKNYDDYTKSTLGFSVSDAVATTPTSATNSQCYTFTQTLQNGSSGNDVFALTYALKQEGFLTQTTSTFDTVVMIGVKRFQEAHATEILNILGLTQGTGVVAEKTRNYLNTKCIVPASVVSAAKPVTSVPPLSCKSPLRSGIKNGVYQYTFSQKDKASWVITLNNKAYGTPTDSYYVPANFSFTATDALDLNRQNQGRFNYLQSLPGTPEGNTEYANLFGSFNNAYYDWAAMTQVNPGCANQDLNPTDIPAAGVNPNRARYIKVSVADWDTLPLALREVSILGFGGAVLQPKTVTATDFAGMYQLPGNLTDGNENTTWSAKKTVSTCANGSTPCETDGDLQVITFDLGAISNVDRVKIVNYGFTDTRVFVIEISTDGNTYKQIAEVRAQQSAPIMDKGVVYGVVSAASTVGPIQY